MMASEFIAGLRERGYTVVRMIEPPVTLLVRIDGDDSLFAWLQDEVGVKMQQYRLSTEVPVTYEARLHTARVEVPEGLNAAQVAQVRGNAIWEAAA